MRDAEVDAIWSSAGVEGTLQREFEVTGSQRFFDSPFPMAEVAAVSLGMCGASAATFHEMRTGVQQDVRVDLERAAWAITSYDYVRVNGRPVERPDLDNPTVGVYRALDQRWVFLQGGFPRLEDRILSVLDCSPSREAIRAAVGNRSAYDLEDAFARVGTSAAMVRSREEWLGSEVGRVTTEQPALQITKIGDAPPRPRRPGRRPLSGVRVVDAARVLAGPTCSRTLAEHGADVLTVCGPGMPQLMVAYLDTAFGKRAGEVDLHSVDGQRQMRALISQSDVFVDGFRLGALEKHGFGHEQIAETTPGCVVVSVNCYGHGVPWAGRPGWEQLAEAVTGMMSLDVDEMPTLLPAPVNDYVTGFLGAFGAMEALRRQSDEGGSWLVRVSLCQTAEWLHRASELVPTDRPLHPLEAPPTLVSVESEFGTISHLPPAVELDATPPFYSRPPEPVGSSRPTWS